MQQAERDVRLPRGGLRRRREPDGDADEAEAQGSVPGDAHDASQSRGRTAKFALRATRPSLACELRQSVPRVDAEQRTIAAPLARRRRRATTGAAYLVDVRRRLAARCRGPRRTSASSASRTASSPAASARATRSGSSRGTRSSGRSSTSRSRTSARSAPRSTRTQLAARRAATSSQHSEAVGVLCEDEDQRAKVEAGRAELPMLRARPHVRRPGRRSRRRAAPTAQATSRTRSTRPSRRSTRTTSSRIIYTSGTTGPPKGCMIRHRNYYAMVARRPTSSPDYSARDDVMLLYLPLAHNFGRLMHLSGPYVGYTIAFLPDPLARRRRRCPQVRPTILPSVPRVYEKVHAARHVAVRRGDGRAAAGSSTGRFASATRGERAAPAGPADAARRWPSSTGSPTGSSSRR